jgi:hypothetical protein
VGSTLGIHYGGETHNHLCYHYVVVWAKLLEKSGLTEEIEKAALSRCNRGHKNGSYCCN